MFYSTQMSIHFIKFYKKYLSSSGIILDLPPATHPLCHPITCPHPLARSVTKATPGAAATISTRPMSIARGHKWPRPQAVA